MKTTTTNVKYAQAVNPFAVSQFYIICYVSRSDFLMRKEERRLYVAFYVRRNITTFFAELTN